MVLNHRMSSNARVQSKEWRGLRMTVNSTGSCRMEARQCDARCAGLACDGEDCANLGQCFGTGFTSVSPPAVKVIAAP
jgi:hypothetical protein